MFGWNKSKRTLVGPDYSGLTSLEKVKTLEEQGELVQLLLLPVEFGGSDVINNIVYVPSFVLWEKMRIDQEIIVPLIKSGNVSQYSARPIYDGKSIIPSKLIITATEPGKFKAEIEIWGSAIN
ncbi:MAG TPA: hypothetical protein VIS99_18005 [Terrimicrobiaceae bacterium]